MNTMEQHDKTTYNNGNEHPKKEKNKKMQKKKMLIKILEN